MTSIQIGKRQISQHGPIVLIVLIGFLLRIKGLTFQSLWLDELHTMNGTSPALSWSQMFDYMKVSEQQPPFFFVLMKLVFSWFGHNEFVARFMAALAGTVSIWAMYFLGKEVLNRKLGLIVAIITCINYYNIFYSQEARPYIFAFLFATLSFAWFIRLLKTPTRKNAIIYSIFTLLFLYTHYYSLFAVSGQAFMALLFILMEKGKDRADLFKSFFLAGIIMAICYTPWAPQLLEAGKIKSTWIPPAPLDFISSYFYGFFGNAAILNPLLVGLLIVYIVFVSREQSIGSSRSNPLILSFIIITGWIFITLLIPYLRSLLVIPMLIPRYTIIVLPAVLLMLGYGIALFRNQLVQYLVLGLFIILSFLQLLFVQHYYSTPIKTQFRELTDYVVKQNTYNFPIINERTHWHQEYYLKKFGSKAMTLTGKKEQLIDSILIGNSPNYSFEGFWLVGAHGDQKPDMGRLAHLDSGWVRLKQQDFNDGWAMLYVTRKDNNYLVIRNTDFLDGDIFADQYRAIWNGSITSKPISVSRGMYRITMDAKGDKGGGEYPHVNIYINGKLVKDFILVDVKETSFDAEIDSDQPQIKIEMTNDFSERGSDRNVFVKTLVLEKLK